MQYADQQAAYSPYYQQLGVGMGGAAAMGGRYAHSFDVILLSLFMGGAHTWIGPWRSLGHTRMIICFLFTARVG